MVNDKKQAKYTGASQPTPAESVDASVRQESTESKKELPASTSAPLQAASTNSTGDLSVSEILAITVVLEDFKALKREVETSWIASKNGKIYWCLERPGHDFRLDENQKLLVDEVPITKIIEKLLAV